MNFTCEICKRTYKSSKTLSSHNQRFHAAASLSIGNSDDSSTLISEPVLSDRELQIRNRMNEYQIIFQDKLRTGEIVKFALHDKSINRASLPKDLRNALDIYEKTIQKSDIVCE